MSAKTTLEPASLTRLLRFIAKHQPIQTQTDANGPVSMIVLIARCGKKRQVSDRLLAALLSQGLLVRHGETVELAQAGRAHLRRMVTADGIDFARQHRDVQSIDLPQEAKGQGRPCQVEVNLSESPLAALSRLRSRSGEPFIDATALAAGERFRIDFERAQMQVRLTLDWDSFMVRQSHHTGGPDRLTLSDSAMEARRRIDRALAAVGPELNGVLLDVCGYLKGLETVERERQWPVRSGKLMLRTALQTLARHYNPQSDRNVLQSRCWQANPA